MKPEQANIEIDKILDSCEPMFEDPSRFQEPLKPGTYAVSVKETVGSQCGRDLILVRDVPRRLAMWIYLNVLRDNPTCENPKFHYAP